MSESNLYITPREADLLLQTSKGDESAFRELFDVYQPLLLSFVFRITKNRVTTEEIVQDIFLKIWMTRESLAGIQSFKNYLFIVSRNQALNLIDKERRARNRQSAYEKEVTGNHDAPEEKMYHLIDEAIDRLPGQQKTAWLLSRHEGLTYAEIAEQMGLSAKTVKNYIAIATDSMKSYLSERNLPLLLLLIAANYV